jgi:multidrug resistance efflux pump
MRLTRHPRIDTLQNEIRRRSHSWDRWIYFALVGAFLVWLFDMFAGDLFYLRANGLVLSNRIVLATQFTAQIDDLNVVEGGEVKTGQVVAHLRSKEAEETLAKLSADIASATARATQFGIRRKVIGAVRSIAQRSVDAARHSRDEAEQLIDHNLITNKRILETIDDELKSRLQLSEMEAEDVAIEQDLPQLQAWIKEAAWRMKSSGQITTTEKSMRRWMASSPVCRLVKGASPAWASL